MTEYAICMNGKEQRYTDYSKALADLQQSADQEENPEPEKKKARWLRFFS